MRRRGCRAFLRVVISGIILLDRGYLGVVLINGLDDLYLHVLGRALVGLSSGPGPYKLVLRAGGGGRDVLPCPYPRSGRERYEYMRPGRPSVVSDDCISSTKCA